MFNFSFIFQNLLLAPLGKTFCFQPPSLQAGSKVNPEIEYLLNATPQTLHLKQGSSDLGQAALKIMRSSNLMRHQVQKGENETDRQLQNLQHEMLVRRQMLEETIRQHRLQLVEEKERKKQTQRDCSKIWRQQMEWRQEQINYQNSQPYNPDEVWTIEGPTRRKQEEAKRVKDM